MNTFGDKCDSDIKTLLAVGWLSEFDVNKQGGLLLERLSLWLEPKIITVLLSELQPYKFNSSSPELSFKNIYTSVTFV